ncbi:MAG: hypothetical protein K2Q13_10105 [Nitrosomonas sp.]|uniref:hypothetical protein n=1 Tax=Nitrosomonas sp. TaxID=42353 RepID=UPI0025EBF3D9|nr:hypothetical protein [Nitrosomonas sp.]MBY0475394.1 hypothetical protein [Nitrosomonas sp.]
MNKAPSFLGAPSVTPPGATENQQISAADVELNYVGKATPMIEDGADQAMGVVTLVGGAAVVANEKVTANSRIFLTSQVGGGTPGFLRVSARTAGTSFTITSSSGTDTSDVAFLIVEPNA